MTLALASILGESALRHPERPAVTADGEDEVAYTLRDPGAKLPVCGAPLLAAEYPGAKAAGAPCLTVMAASGLGDGALDVEDVVMRRPAISQVAFIGLPDDAYGEEVAAVVVREPGSDAPDDGTPFAWSQQFLAKHKYPHLFLKRELRQRFAVTT